MENRNLESVYVLLGGFRDGDYFIPVQMEIKKQSNKNANENILYMTAAMTKIEADVLERAGAIEPAPSLISASVYSVADIFKNVNTVDKHFLKYLPDRFLSNEQKS